MFQQEEQLKSSDIKELYYIVNIDNLPSILEHGILSHNQVREQKLFKTAHDISNPGVQKCRNKTFRSPRTEIKRPLHDYVNFYPQPYNAMILVIQKEVPAEKLCVLRVNAQLLDDRENEAVMTIRNAASHQAGFFAPKQWMPSPGTSEALSSLRLSGLPDKTYVKPWIFNTQKQKRQSEVLFPNQVTPDYISGIFVSGAQSQQRVSKITYKVRPDINICVHPTMFPEPKKGAFSRSIEKFGSIRNALEMENKHPNPGSKRKRVEKRDDAYYYPNPLTSC
ncbi:MAG: DUF4433 domain-containing protein [Gammaproteobacteria bacterium]|nr:DUF4433 domain-containing protein [Gammaproteobacteria bacterium]